MKTYTLEKKPQFANGQWVTVDFAHLGLELDDTNRYVRGQVKGIVMVNVIDFWIVDFEDALQFVAETYPFQCLSVPHVAIVDEPS